MKLLVVNADDLGADQARNRGIFEAVRAGVVTSVSVLVNGPAFAAGRDELAELAREGLSVGLHLNLSEGVPLAAGLCTLTTPEGLFRGKWAAHKRLEDAADGELRLEVAREIEAQLGALRAAGFAPDHLDGHQHVHLCRAVLPLVLAAAKRAGIPWFRVPTPLPGARELPTGAARFAQWAVRARPAVQAAGRRCTDAFLGLDLVDRLDRNALSGVVARVAAGITEWMVHPGCAGPDEGPFSGFSTDARDRERLALLHPEFRQLLAQAGVELGPFPRGLP